jgi:hypothetical protein
MKLTLVEKTNWYAIYKSDRYFVLIDSILAELPCKTDKEAVEYVEQRYYEILKSE